MFGTDAYFSRQCRKKGHMNIERLLFMRSLGDIEEDRKVCVSKTLLDQFCDTSPPSPRPTYPLLLGAEGYKLYGHFKKISSDGTLPTYAPLSHISPGKKEYF